jgi:predicted membrane channel-forming protein YqfA (hemolysin III family)
MGHNASTVPAAFDAVFLALQGLVTAFLLLHDWVPLGRLSNLAAIRGEDSLSRRIFVTLLPAVPTGVCLIYGARFFGARYPGWLDITLWITYGLLLAGLLKAWWIPYLLIPDPARAARYQVIFAGTHTFLPRRNGIAPDTLHTVFHLAVLATAILLPVRGYLLGPM